jgi:GR25 family glycosyltransferase involved in LPS biosynthesis
MNKLEGFPTVYYLSLEESLDRRIDLEKQFHDYGIENIHGVVSKRFAECDDIIHGKFVHELTDASKGCCTSHMKCIKRWLTETNEPIGFFCEDDLSLKTVEYWNFTWKEFLNSLPNDWDVVQLMWVRDSLQNVEFRNRYMDDWGASAYILKRDYAEKLVNTYYSTDEFQFDIPVDNWSIQPIVENLIFLLGKAYGVPLFVEEVYKFDTTLATSDEFTGLKDDWELVEGQGPSHITSHDNVLNWWKENQNLLLESLMKTQRTPLEHYAYDTENPEKNFNLARWYHEQGQTASAISFYLRAADRTDDLNLAYECLLHMAKCFHQQENRTYTVRGLYQHATSILPKRPEAHYLLAKCQEAQTQYAECYTTCCTALSLCDFNSSPLLNDVEYPGKYGIVFQKAVSSYWWGKSDECRKIFQDLKNNYTLDEVHYKSVGDNLMRLASNVPEHQIKYDKSRYEKVRHKFDGLETIDQNYSQIFQDMFILAVLNGKKNGTYLEIGAQQPFYQSNTALLETKFGWKGVSIEIKEDLCKMFEEQRKNTILCQDATEVDYGKLLKDYNTNVIDYLQVDIEPSKTTFEALLAIPFDEYKFAIVTYEHDHYVDMTNSYRTKSRRYMELMGYELVVANVSGNDFCPFEDWWVHPDLVDKETIERFKSIQDVTDVRTYMYTS